MKIHFKNVSIGIALLCTFFFTHMCLCFTPQALDITFTIQNTTGIDKQIVFEKYSSQKIRGFSAPAIPAGTITKTVPSQSTIKTTIDRASYFKVKALGQYIKNKTGSDLFFPEDGPEVILTIKENPTVDTNFAS
jgi:hypothetical protein